MKTWKIRILQLFLPLSFLSPLAQCHHDSAPTRTWRFCLSWSHIVSPERKEKMRSSVSWESPVSLAATATTAIAAACIFVLGPLDFSHLVMLQQFHNTILLRRGHWDRIFPDFGMQCVSNCETMVRIIASSLHVCNSGSANRVLQKTGRFLNFGPFYIVLHHYIIPIHSTMF